MRLTQTVRCSILSQLDERAFGQRRIDLNKREYALAAVAHGFHIDAATRRKIDELPPGWLPREGHIKVIINNNVIPLRHEGSVAVPADMHGNGLRLNSKDPLAKKIAAYKADREALRTEADQAKREAKAILNSCSSQAALLRAWPELKPILDKLAPAPAVAPSKLPVTEVKKLNKKFGLPVKA